MTTVDFHVSDLSVDSTLTDLGPILEAGSAVTALSGHNAIIPLNVTVAAIKNAFLFTSDSADLSDEVSENERNTATTTVTAAGLPVPNLATDEVAPSTHAEATSEDYDNQIDPNATEQTIAADYVRYFSQQLLGSSGLSDSFSNEAAMVTSVESTNLSDTNANDIRGKAATQATMDKLFDNLFQAGESGAVAQARLSNSTIMESNGNSEGVYTYKFPFIAGDTIRYHVTLKHGAIDFGGGSKTIADRKYLVIVTVTA